MKIRRKEEDLLGDCNEWGRDAEALTRKQAIYFMLKNENNVVECCINPSDFNYFHIKKGVLRGTTFVNTKLWRDMPWDDFFKSKLIKFMAIEHKEKNLKQRVRELEDEVERLKEEKSYIPYTRDLLYKVARHNENFFKVINRCDTNKPQMRSNERWKWQIKKINNKNSIIVLGRNIIIKSSDKKEDNLVWSYDDRDTFYMSVYIYNKKSYNKEGKVIKSFQMRMDSK